MDRAFNPASVMAPTQVRILPHPPDINMSKRIKGQSRKHAIWQIPENEFIIEVACRDSLNEVFRAFGISDGSGYNVLRQRIKELNLDTSHMERTPFTRFSAENLQKYPKEDILKRDSSHTGKVARATFRSFRSISYRCKECGQEPIWHGKSLVLIFDHINGNNRDHRPSNLRWLCPNCNSQTDTFCGRNFKNPLRSGKRR